VSAPDPRLHAFRPDLAASALRGQVAADRYVDGTPASVVVGHAALRRAPIDAAPMDTEILFGQRATVYETREGWAWVQCTLDSYVGYIRTEALSAEVVAASHRVAVPRTWVYPAPDIKAPPVLALPMNARLTVAGSEGRFAAFDHGFVVADHLRPIAEPEPDFVAVAEQFLGAPYLWGGKTWAGLDCSGLVQVALEAAGHVAPRDTDLQQAAVGKAVPGSDLQRGDLVFWRGHVGAMLDAETLLHANAHHMQVAREPLSVARARIAQTGTEILTVRRLDRQARDRGKSKVRK
jgi:cell wall-associated NlpC family hydrolase